jgi:hypothetical protein
MHHLANAAHFVTSRLLLNVDLKKRVAIASSGGGYCPFGQSFLSNNRSVLSQWDHVECPLGQLSRSF